MEWTVLQKLKDPDEFVSHYAIFILNQPILCEPELMKKFWRKGKYICSALRVLVDGGSNRWLNFLSTHEITDSELPDFISGDFDSITPKTRDYFESRKVNMIFTPDQNETDFTKALRCLKSICETKNRNIKLVVAVSENCGRFDQAMANINTLHRSEEILEDVPVILLSSQNATWVLKPGTQRIFITEEFVKKQYSCGLIPLCGPTLTTTNGLKWNLENDTMKMGDLVSSSNTYAALEISITCDRHLVWTTQYCESIE